MWEGAYSEHSEFLTRHDLTSDAPEVEVERTAVHTGEGYRVKLICFVFADPPAQVSPTTMPICLNDPP